MKKIGFIDDREVYYINVKDDVTWNAKLPFGNWCAFTVVDADGRELIDEIVARCLDSNVSYTCSSGELADETELAFDIEIVRREIEKESKSGIPPDYEVVPLTTVHNDFSEGLWFATFVATTGDDEIDKVVCIDVTNDGVLEQLKRLVDDINNGWLPPD